VSFLALSILQSLLPAVYVVNSVPISGFENLTDPETLKAATETLAKLGLAVILGGLIGIERELNRRPAGVRTHMLVCLGCALFTELSQAFLSASPDRVAAQVVTGVGFLGAGTILRTGIDVKGLTTAASIWAVAAIGMAVSIAGPFFWVAIIATFLTLGTLHLVGVFEDRVLEADIAGTLVLNLHSRETLPAVIQAIGGSNSQLRRLEVIRTEEGFGVKAAIRGEKAGVIEAIASLPGVLSAEWDQSR
jgi:putative Mg2+ transporter-C (MgtC) family protein